MRKQVAKKINKKVTELLISWIQTIVPEDEQHKVTPKTMLHYYPKKNTYRLKRLFIYLCILNDGRNKTLKNY